MKKWYILFGKESILNRLNDEYIEADTYQEAIKKIAEDVANWEVYPDGYDNLEVETLEGWGTELFVHASFTVPTFDDDGQEIEGEYEDDNLSFTVENDEE